MSLARQPLHMPTRYMGSISPVVRSAYLIRLISSIDETSLDPVAILIQNDPAGLRNYLRCCDATATEDEIEEEVENLHRETRNTYDELVLFPLACLKNSGRVIDDIDLGGEELWEFINETVREDKVIRRMAARESMGKQVDPDGEDVEGTGLSDYSGETPEGDEEMNMDAESRIDSAAMSEDDDKYDNSDVDMEDS